MNNRFNFRMWDINTKRFYYMYLDELIGLTRTISIPKDATIQQYTGLNDSKGKEIYEGDIVNYKTWEGRHDGIIEENQTQVQFKDGAYYPRYINDECEDSWYSFKVYDLEVVGNVFETPHLDKNE